MASHINRLWRLYNVPAAGRFERALRNTREAQLGRLQEIVAENADTEFGREHEFSRIKTYEDYREAVPVCDWKDLAPQIQRMAGGEQRVLVADRVTAFLPTSGSTCDRKLLPWTRSLKREFESAIAPWISGMMRSCPAAWQGPAYWSISPRLATERVTAGGISIGFDSDSSYLSGPLRRLVDATLAVPSEVAQIHDWNAWQYVTLAFLLKRDHLSFISVWSPTFLLALLRELKNGGPYIVRDIANGKLNSSIELDPRTRTSLSRAFTSDPSRARVLENHLQRYGATRFELIWPHLAAISCWTSAGSAAPAAVLQKMFPQADVLSKGLVATEGIISIPLQVQPSSAAAVCSHFLEFADPSGETYPAWELQNGNEYSVILTTRGGLYRYRMHDVVRVTGFEHTCPLIEFLGRDGTCDLTGEKLAETFVQACLQALVQRYPALADFAVLAPNRDSNPPRYALFVSGSGMRTTSPAQLAEALDSELRRNCHYDLSRNLGQLGPVEIATLRGDPVELWAAYQERLGGLVGRRGDLKSSYFELDESRIQNLHDLRTVRIAE